MILRTAENMLSWLENQGFLKNRSRAEAFLLCQENLLKPLRWGFWIAFPTWLLFWLLIGSSIVTYYEHNSVFYAYCLIQLLIAIALLYWPHKSSRWEPLLLATLISLGFSNLFLTLLSPYWVVAALLYALLLMELGITHRKLAMSLCGIVFFVLGVTAIALHFSIHLKGFSLICIGLGALLVGLPYIALSRSKVEPALSSSDDESNQY